ncbi:MAG: 4-hydroxy-tetrahydrodipicolinate reductase [Bacteroidales bacterium]|nr:4-hydroxy-tetrahydrodipicolinate reductase [Bacteroidales bacterium]
MNIALLGYGRIGKEIEKTALERNHQIVLIIDETNIADLTVSNLKKADAAIDFSTPSSAYNNIMKCFEADIPVVSGTTGWLHQLDSVYETCKRENKAFFYASNFSIGVNILFALNRVLARIMDGFEGYEVGITEVHHVHKLDAPSGTAITLAQDLISHIRRKEKWELAPGSDPRTLKIKAIREDEVMGIHRITYDSEMDGIEISHSAKNRKGFALGALMAVEFIRNRKGVYTMSDLLHIE